MDWIKWLVIRIENKNLAHNEPPVIQGNVCLAEDIGLHIS